MTRGRPSRTGKTQTERRTHTRRALLDATFSCLVERGYAGTSTNDIIRVAGVSRGALLHHFASKAELMGEAVEDVFTRCEMEFREGFAALPIEQRTLDHALEELWAIFRGPTFDAAVELLVAARTDTELREVLHAVLQRFRRNVLADFGVLFPATAAGPDGSTLVELAFAVLEGAALNHDVGFADEADAVVALLRSLARQRSELPPTAPPTETTETTEPAGLDGTDTTERT
jgi:AcrR family transcriptional regulator